MVTKSLEEENYQQINNILSTFLFLEGGVEFCCFCGLPVSPVNWDITAAWWDRCQAAFFIFSFPLKMLPKLQLIRACVHGASLQLSAQTVLPQCCCWAGNWVSAGNLCSGKRGALHQSCPCSCLLAQLPFSLLKTSKSSGDRSCFLFFLTKML